MSTGAAKGPQLVPRSAKPRESAVSMASSEAALEQYLAMLETKAKMAAAKTRGALMKRGRLCHVVKCGRGVAG